MLAEATTLTLLYTAGLGGRLELLPRLMTRIRVEKTTIKGPVLLVDLGCSCEADSWICEATDGRGMLVAMDAMGYDAFHIGPADALYRKPATVQQLRQVIQTPLAAGPWSARVTRKRLVIRLAARLDVLLSPVEDADLLLVLQLGNFPRADVESDGTVRILTLDGGWVNSEPLLGRLDVTLTTETPYIALVSQRQLESPDKLTPDSSIAEIVEFVRSEAQVATRKRGPIDQTG
ncbi:MAG TPA: hypothetical protein VKQ72_18620 [Aggregatilineales bacterium]|nr:hypothetical protein [Aggregatilineales bacterium]